MKRIDSLTEEQKAMMPVWRDKWIDIGLQTGEADWDKFDRSIRVCYEKAGLPFPGNVVRVDSPLVGAFAASIANKILNGGAVGRAIGSAVYDAVDGAVRDAISRAVDGEVRDAVDGEVRDAVDGEVRIAVGRAIGSAVDDAVGIAISSAVGSAIGSAVDDAVSSAVGVAISSAVGSAVHGVDWHYWFGGQFWVGGRCGSPSYASFFTEVCGLELSIDIMDRAIAYRELCESVNYIWPNRNFIMVCNRPSIIKRDEEGRLHSETGPSVLYRDGFCLYSWHGTTIPREWIEDKPPSPQEALIWGNVEQRRAACELIGWNEILNQLNAKVIDRDPDPQIGTLLEVDLPGSGKEKFLQVKCGTGRDFALPVPPEMQTAMQSNSWTYGLDNLNIEVRT